MYLVQGVAADVAGGSGEEYFDCHCGGWQVHWLKGWNPEKIFDLFFCISRAESFCSLRVLSKAALPCMTLSS